MSSYQGLSPSCGERSCINSSTGAEQTGSLQAHAMQLSRNPQLEENASRYRAAGQQSQAFEEKPQISSLHTLPSAAPFTHNPPVPLLPAVPPIPSGPHTPPVSSISLPPMPPIPSMPSAPPMWGSRPMSTGRGGHPSLRHHAGTPTSDSASSHCHAHASGSRSPSSHRSRIDPQHTGHAGPVEWDVRKSPEANLAHKPHTAHATHSGHSTQGTNLDELQQGASGHVGVSIGAATAAAIGARRKRRPKLANGESRVCQVCGDVAVGCAPFAPPPPYT